MRSTARRFLIWLGASALAVAPLYPAQNQSIGIILEAQGTHLKAAAASSGASIYPGDLINTESSGLAMLRVGQTSFQLTGNSTASFYSGPNGSVAELRSGSFIVSATSPNDNFEIFASDVRIVPDTERPIYARVTIESPCELLVTSQHGRLQVTSGKETKFIEGGKSYRVVPEHTVADFRDVTISPDDPDYHRNHSHRSCAAAIEHLGGKAPSAPGSSHFLITAFVVVGTATAFAIDEALESPDRP